jgi:alkylation response protein AidB-like acyl-CoA dehydrogenase
MRDNQLTEDQRQIREAMRKLAQERFAPGAAEADRRMEPPVGNLDVLRDNGFCGLFIPEAYGGQELGVTEMVVVVEEIARACANTAMLYSLTDGATTRTIVEVGTEEQKRRYLPRLAAGEIHAAWSMSEPDAGSDLGAIRARAEERGDHYILNGEKTWCSCAQLADLFIVFVRISDAPGIRGVGALLVERDSPGLEVGKHLDLIGLRATGMAGLHFHDTPVPRENLIVAPGEMKHLLRAFDKDRVGGNPPICLGVASGAVAAITTYLKERRQFGRSLSEFQGLQWKVADIVIRLEAARALLYGAARELDEGRHAVADAAITKTFVNEACVEITNQCMQLAGGYGLSNEFPFERNFRDVRGMSIGYGSTEVMRSVIAQEVFSGRYPL